MRVSINGDSPEAGWFRMENPKQKCMIWGVPPFQETSYVYFSVEAVGIREKFHFLTHSNSQPRSLSMLEMAHFLRHFLEKWMKSTRVLDD